ncbi:hypothetical protein G6F56_004436 [Rhizopus delemar]|nr:hypothetical protein G6F56_004436 [Rhizopus delemar]
MEEDAILVYLPKVNVDQLSDSSTEDQIIIANQPEDRTSILEDSQLDITSSGNTSEFFNVPLDTSVSVNPETIKQEPVEPDDLPMLEEPKQDIIITPPQHSPRLSPRHFFRKARSSVSNEFSIVKRTSLLLGKFNSQPLSTLPTISRLKHTPDIHADALKERHIFKLREKTKVLSKQIERKFSFRSKKIKSPH